MKKLKPCDILEILDDRLAGKSAYKIAKRHRITARWVRHLAAEFMRTGRVPQSLPSGRKPIPITAKEVQIISDAFEVYQLGAVRLGSCLGEFMDVRIPHNRIHRIMRKPKLAKRSYKKAHRRKWVRFERYKSNSLWHTDWTKIGNKWLIVFLDDASRFILGWGPFDHATTENSILVLERAIAAYGAPKAMLTGHDAQFCSNQNVKIKKPEPNSFQKFLKGKKIKHIFARVNHPQTNGKCERVFGTIKRKIKAFGSLEELIHWYNSVRPHMSLLRGLETPALAYVRKMQSKKKISVEMVVR